MALRSPVAATRTPSPVATPTRTASARPTRDPGCGVPDQGMLDALWASGLIGSLHHARTLVISAVGTDNGQASRYTYLAGELDYADDSSGVAVFAAVDPYRHGSWLSVNRVAKQNSGAFDADTSDAALDRNRGDYARVIACATGG